MSRTEIRLSGFGGQGIIMTGYIIGEAVAIHDGKNATFTQSYGPEARGGAAGSQVVMSSDPIHHPVLIQPTSAIIMSQAAYDKYVPNLAPGGILVIDDSLVMVPENPPKDIRTFGIPATQIAGELGNARAANTVMLGFWTAIIGVVRKEAMRQSLADSVPSKTVDLNLNAFDIGYEKGLEAKETG